MNIANVFKHLVELLFLAHLMAHLFLILAASVLTYLSHKGSIYTSVDAGYGDLGRYILVCRLTARLRSIVSVVVSRSLVIILLLYIFFSMTLMPKVTYEQFNADGIKLTHRKCLTCCSNSVWWHQAGGGEG